MNFLRALLGLLVAFTYHLPRLVYRLLLVSYHAAFNPQDTLTATLRSISSARESY